MTLDELEKFIEANSGASIEFGTAEQAPSSDWVRKAETALGCVLPTSYRWFLANYGGGEIHGDEVFSIYQMPFESVVGGDVVGRTLGDRKSGLLKDTEIAICATDYGEIFVLDTKADQIDGEFPVLRVIGQNREEYAGSFGDFIVKFVGDAAV